MLPELDLRAPFGLFIGGEWQKPVEGRTFETVCAATGDVVATVAEATEPDVDRAARAAHEAFQTTWADTTAEERYDALMGLALAIRREADRIADIEVVDAASTLRTMRQDVRRAIQEIESYAGFARQLRGKTVNLDPDLVVMTLREPYGVVAQVIPFNHPFGFAARALAISVATGNTVILKPSEYTPLTTLELAEIARDLFPPGVVNVLTGFGPSCGAPLIEHELVGKVHFRGSLPTGNQVRIKCAERGIPCSLELGGKNPFIVYPDVDIKKTVAGAVKGLNLGHQGQSCQSATRLLVHDSIYDEFRDLLVEQFGNVNPGLPWDPSTDMGAIVSRPQYDRILDYIRSGVEQGARLLVGGGPWKQPGLENGLFIEPTIFEVDDPTIRIATEEIFGPVVCLMRWQDEDEMFAVANSLDFGLTASVWSQDVSTVYRAARRLQAGTVWINQHTIGTPGVPRGHWKRSGVGQERILEEIESYTQEKTIMLRL